MGRMNDFEAPMTVLFVDEGGGQDERLLFTGTGGEYFRIWSVGLLLTIATLGIYSAWAKVRRLRYVYRNTRLAQAGFDYHGTPGAILRGRVIALLFFVAHNIAWGIAPVVGVVMLAVLAALVPWLIWKSLQFKLHNSSYRGIRFGCGGRPGQVYLVYLLLPLLSLCSLSLLAPLSHQRIKKFQHEESYFGATYFSFHATMAAFYKLYLQAAAASIGGALLIGYGFALAGLFDAISAAGGLKMAGATVQATFLAFVAVNYLWFSLMFSIHRGRVQQLVWNHVRLGGHQFRCQLSTAKLAWIACSNLAGVIVSLGLFLPFAQMRMLKYRIESMTMVPAGSLDGYIETTQGIVASTGRGAADLLEFDLSL